MSIRRSTRTMLFLPLAAFAACGDATRAVAPAHPGDVTASAIPAGSLALDWQAQSRAMVAANRFSAPASARLYAAVSIAQHRAILDVDAANLGGGGRALAEARRGAVAGASVRVLGWFFPSAAPSLEEQLQAQGDAGPGNVHPHFSQGVAIGRASGDRSVTHLAGDRFTKPWEGSIPLGDGMWTTAVLPPSGVMLGQTVPYYLASGSQFRPAPHPAFGSAAFAAATQEVVTRTVNRTPAELAIARQWDSPAGTPTPIGYWNSVAAAYILERGLDERAATEVLSVMHAAVFDAMIACWEAKYHYWLLRPSQADAGVALALPQPNFPAYPSGHSCASASAGRVLMHYFPERQAELMAWVEEAGLSRILAGIHYRFDITAGQDLGRSVAALALSRGAL